MRDFIKISKYSGMREDLVQAGGGNSSFKISEKEMVIKSSGYQLSDITETDGYALVNPQIIKERFYGAKDLNALTDVDSRLILNDAFIQGGKPSIETFLHVILMKYTLHTHPIVVNALTCRKSGKDILKKLFPESLYVPYATPGIELAKVYLKTYWEDIDCNRAPDIVFLQNHGLIVSADTGEAVIEKTENVLHVLEEYLNADYQSYHDVTRIWSVFADKIVWKVTDACILWMYKEYGGMWRHAFCPDCIVFLGKKALELQDDFSAKNVEVFCKKYGEPVMVIYKNNLYIVADSVKNAMETQSVMSFSAQVMKFNEGIGCELLSDEEQNFLLNWDEEKYRKKLR